MPHAGRVLAVAFVLASMLAACGGSSEGNDQVRVVLDPSEVTIETGGEQSFTATVTAARDPAVSWTTTGGTITGSGGTVVYTAPSSEGTHEVVATSVQDPSKSATAVVTVDAGGKARIEIVSDESLLLTGVGKTAEVEAVVFAADGSLVENAVVEWTTDGPGVVEVNQAGTVTALVDTGYATVTASYDELESEHVSVAIAEPTSGTELVHSERVLAIAPDGTSASLVRDGESESLVAGDIVVSDAGLLSRITAVEMRNDRVVLALEDVALADAFERVVIEGVSDPIQYEATFTDSTVRVQSSGSQLGTQEFPMGALECETTAGLELEDISLTGASFSTSHATQVQFHYDSDVGDLEVAQMDNVHLEGTVGSIEYTGGGDGGIRCSKNLRELSTPLFTFWGVVSITADLTLKTGFQATADFQGESLKADGPRFDATVSFTAGVRYDASTDRWMEIKDYEQDLNVDVFDLEAALPTDLELFVGPFGSAEIGLSGRVGIWSFAGVEVLEPEVTLGPLISVPIGSRHESRYSGPAYGLRTLVGADVKLDLSGGVRKLLDRLKIDNLTLTFASIDIINEVFDGSARPLVEASVNTVTESVRLTATTSHLNFLAAPLVPESRVEFVAFSGGKTTGEVLGSDVVDAEGTASIMWTPSQTDNGEVHVVALLYDRTFGAVGMPFRSDNELDLTVNVDAPATGSITGVWRGTWTDAQLGYSDSFSANLFHSDGDLTGDIAVEGSPCLTSSEVNGIVEGDGASFGTISGPGKMTFYIVFTGSVFTGDFSIEGGDCDGTFGQVRATRDP